MLKSAILLIQPQFIKVYTYEAAQYSSKSMCARVRLLWIQILVLSSDKLPHFYVLQFPPLLWAVVELRAWLVGVTQQMSAIALLSQVLSDANMVLP